MTDSDSLFQPVLLVQIKHSPGKPVFKPCLHYVIMFNSYSLVAFFFTFQLSHVTCTGAYI